MDSSYEVVPDGMKLETKTWVEPPGAEQARPTCFGDSQPWMADHSRESRLCSACTSLGHLNTMNWDSINNFREIVVDHHPSMSALVESARGGCHFCGLLLIAWEENCLLCQKPSGEWVGKRWDESCSLYGGIKLKFERVAKTNRLAGVEVGEIQITILCGDLLPNMSGRLICAPTETVVPALPESCLPSTSDTNTGSPASISRIKTWLDICTSSHPSCSQVDSQPPPLPTRVIAVGKKGSSRCYLVTGKEKNGHYATLSHCWGDPANRPLTTTDESLSYRQKNIDDDELPKTFRHAVEVCREMSIEYLWIDSLCIIQDQKSQEDWTREAPKMGLVYGNSRLTILAAAAENSTQGCFKERLGSIVWPCRIVLLGQACSVFRYPTIHEEYGDPGDTWQQYRSRNVLHRRAWVLQEQILSRRSITFSDNRLMWRCPTLSTSEKYPLGIPRSPSISGDRYRLFHCVINDLRSLIPKEEDIDIYTCWYRIVEDFTARELTFDGDRLSAIAGIAKAFGVAANDTYYAGLWGRDMIRGLLWRTPVSYAITAVRSARAPSWTWASLNCEVEYRRILPMFFYASRIPLSPLVDILEVLDTPTCENHPFGPTSKASLRLSGVLLAVERHKTLNFRLLLVENGTPVAEEIAIDDWDTFDFDMSAQTPLVCLPVCVSHSPPGLDAPGDAKSRKASWEKALETGSDSLEQSNTVYCLVLQPVEEKQDTYCRVGICGIGSHKTIDIARMALGERRPLTIV